MRLPIVEMGGMPMPVRPRISAFTRTFWDGLAQGRLLGTRCTCCARISFPPRNLCRGCWGRDLSWIDLASRGTLYSYTRVHVTPSAFRADAPYAIGIVDLDDDVRLMCRLIGPVSATDLDRAVEMVVLAYADGRLFGARLREAAISTRPRDP